MSKRSRSFEADYERQSKVRIREKHVNSRNEKNMEKIYEKTNKILFDAAKREFAKQQTKEPARSSSSLDWLCVACSSATTIDKCNFCEKRVCSNCIYTCGGCSEFFCGSCCTETVKSNTVLCYNCV